MKHGVATSANSAIAVPRKKPRTGFAVEQGRGLFLIGAIIY
jgi:hypothetical protein